MNRFHKTAQIDTDKIGDGTRIWQFCVILEGARIGSDCNICSHCLIENDVKIGDRVTVKSGVQLWDGVRLEDDVFVGPNVTFTNDKTPRSKCYPEKFLETVISEGASIGANATILPGVSVGTHAVVGAGSVVTKDIPPYTTVVGNPARKHKTSGEDSLECCQINEGVGNVIGVSSVPIASFVDSRGHLSVAEVGEHIPFGVQRIFFVSGVKKDQVRGEHAHKKCHQFLLCMHGSVTVVVDDGMQREEIVLDDTFGLHLRPGVWGIQKSYSENAVLAVLASDKYDADDYIHDYDEFKTYVTTL